jgi:RND family efflux transporter MFP subunit
MKLNRTLLLVLGLVVLGSIVAVLSFSGHDAKASNDSENQATPVAVAIVQRKPLAQSVTLSGEFVPFQQVDVHAKVAGYIRKIYVDVGDRVKAGQTLAVLEVPELSAQFEGADASVQRSRDGVRRAESDLNRARSLHEAAHLDYTRLQQAAQARPGLIAQQELDDALAKDKESEAQISADEAALAEARGALDVSTANQKQYKALSDYTRIAAPFSGVITKRWVDTGALVQAGTNSSTQALPVVSVAQTDLFRLTLPVPESAVPSVRLGSVVTVHVQALNRDFEGKVSRFADDLSQETRTMHTEVDVHNSDGTLVPGMYAEVKLRLSQNDDALSVPIEAVTRNGAETSVLLVDRDNRISDRKITIGLESADRLQVLSGLDEGDRVVVGNRSQFRRGELVDPKPIALRKTAQEF